MTKKMPALRFEWGISTQGPDWPIRGELPKAMRLPSLERRAQEWQAKKETLNSQKYDWSRRVKLEDRTQKITLPDGSSWEYCYVWLMDLKPGSQSKVTVRYFCQIPPQENVWRVENQWCYRGRLSPKAKMAHNIPESFYRKVGPGTFFFISYVLRSGATWHGPIGFEQIRMVSNGTVPLDRAILHFDGKIRRSPHELILQISQADPDSDLILAIPTSAAKPMP